MPASSEAALEAAPTTPTTSSPKSILVDFQLRRENRALLDKIMEQTASLAREKEEREKREKELFEKLEAVELKVQQTQASFDATVIANARGDNELLEMINRIKNAPSTSGSLRRGVQARS